jgi:decaprenylphospho-beta-D-erythro-pentofuranosid-2-ulose 2-reductase
VSRRTLAQPVAPRQPAGNPAAGWVVILGATSPIARAVAGELARRGHDLLLAGRDAAELERIAADVRVRYSVSAEAVRFDALDAASPAALAAAVEARTHGRLAGVVAAVGVLGDATRAAHDADAAVEIIRTNFVSLVDALTRLAGVLEQRGGGFIIGIASVAGDRGRQSNYIYGSAKGAFALWLQGLRNRLWPAGVRVITVKPGFVDTGMTYGLAGLFLVADPARVGATIARALDRRRDVIYVPGFWRYIMWVIRALPEAVFKRLKL